MESTFSKSIKIYQSIALTIIAATLILILLKMPIPYTYENVNNGKLKMEQIPITRVTGSVDVNNTVTVEIER